MIQRAPGGNMSGVATLGPRRERLCPDRKCTMPGASDTGSPDTPRSIDEEARPAPDEQAQRILAVAREAAAMLYAEAQSESRSLREEVTRWAEAYRARAEAEAKGLLDEARREAAGLRADALSQAMAEAQETARRYVDMAAAVATEEGTSVRVEAACAVRRAADGVERATGRLQRGGLVSPEDLASLRREAELLTRLAEATAPGSSHASSGASDAGSAGAVAPAPRDPDVGDAERGSRGPVPRQRASSEGSPLGSRIDPARFRSPGRS